MDILQNAKIIGSIRGGYQHINVEEATKRGIAVFSVPGRNAHSVSDYTIAMILAEARELSRNSSHIMAGDWLNPLFKTHYQPELYEKTIGIVGLGSVGRLVAKKLINGWDMRVLGYDPFISKEDALKMGVRLVDLPTLFRESDFISIHAKATKNNNKMVNGELLSLMKPTAFFINTARASLVDNIALYRILKDRKIAGAALDVMDVEPIPKGDPFLSLENVTITGHLAGNSSDTISNSPYLLVKEIIDFIKNGSKVGLVNPEVLENEKFFTWKLKMKERL
jgi:D-3-phosphoglycerate dehydrogenase